MRGVAAVIISAGWFIISAGWFRISAGWFRISAGWFIISAGWFIISAGWSRAELLDPATLDRPLLFFSLAVKMTLFFFAEPLDRRWSWRHPNRFSSISGPRNVQKAVTV